MRFLPIIFFLTILSNTPTSALFLNTTTVGVELLTSVPTGSAEFSNQQYITSWISTPSITVRWATLPQYVRNSTTVLILLEEDWIAHRQGIHNKSCVNGASMHFIPGCLENNIDDCLTEKILDIPLPRLPGTYLIAAYSNNGSSLPYYLNNYGSAYLENEYYKQAEITGDFNQPHQGNSSMLCYQWWLRPPNATSLEYIFLGNQLQQIGDMSRIYNAPSFWATAPTLTLLEGGATYEYSIFYENGDYLRSPLMLQTLSNCYQNVIGQDTGGLWSQTTMQPNTRQMRMLTVNQKSDFGRKDNFVVQHDNRSASIRITISATNNLRQSKNQNMSCTIKHWLTPIFVYDQAVWAPARLTSDFQRSYQRLPADGETPYIEIPIEIIDDENKWATEKNARMLGNIGAFVITFLLGTRLLSILWWNFFDLADLRDANNMPSVRGSGATRPDVTELGSQRYYILSAWPLIWLLQSMAMLSQLKMVQEHCNVVSVIVSLATTPVYLGAVPLPLISEMVEQPFWNNGNGQHDKSYGPLDDLRRERFVGKPTKVDALGRERWPSLFPSGQLGLLNTSFASYSYRETLDLTGGLAAKIKRNSDGYNAYPLNFGSRADAPPFSNYTMITGIERSFDVAGSITTLWRILSVCSIVWTCVLGSRFLFVRYIRLKMRRLALQYRLCPVFDPRIVVGPGGAVTIKAMSKIQVEEMKQRVNVMENTDALDKDEDDEDEDPFAKLNEDVENGEEENQPLIVLTMTAPEGLELIAKRTRDYMTTNTTCLFLLMFSWSSLFQACGGGMASGIIYGQILGGLMMLTGVIVFCLILYYFLMVITLGTSYRRTSVHDVLDMCYEMQRTDQEARVILKTIGNKVGRWSVANRDYRKMFYEVGHLLDLWIFGHGYLDEDALREKKQKEQEEEKTRDGTEVIVKKKAKYQARKPYLFTVYILFHFAIQGLIVGTEANSDVSGISQILHYFMLETVFCYSLIYVWPHNVPIGNWLHSISMLLLCSAIGFVLFIHPVIRTTIGNGIHGLDPNVTEQTILILLVLAIVPLLTIEIVGTIVQLRLFILFLWKYYIIDFFYRIGKQIYLCFVYTRHEIKKARRKRRARIKSRNAFGPGSKNSKRPSSRSSSVGSLEESDSEHPHDGQKNNIDDILKTDQQHVKIDLAQQQMNRYVNADDGEDDGKAKKSELLGFTFTEEEIANWKPTSNNNNDDDDTDSNEDDDENNEKDINKMSYEQREAKANKIEMELTELNATLKDMGVSTGGHKKPEVVAAHIAASKKEISKKWVRTKLRFAFGDTILESAGATKNILKKDRTEALWAIEKKKRAKERRMKEWSKYSQSEGKGKKVSMGNMGLEKNDTGKRGR